MRKPCVCEHDPLEHATDVLVQTEHDGPEPEYAISLGECSSCECPFYTPRTGSTDETCPDCGVITFDLHSHRGEFHARQSGAPTSGSRLSIAHKREREAFQAVCWVVEAWGGTIVVPRVVMEKDWRLTAEDTVDGGRRFTTAEQHHSGRSSDG